jgi:hypothetical protein
MWKSSEEDNFTLKISLIRAFSFFVTQFFEQKLLDSKMTQNLALFNKLSGKYPKIIKDI